MHKLLPIGEAYSAALDESKKVDEDLNTRKQAILEQVKMIDSRIAEVKSNASTVEESIYQLLQEALVQLQEESQKKILMLTAEEMELRRQLRKVQQEEDFMQKEQEQLKPLPFLSSWVQHQKLRNEQFHAVPFSTADVRVKADIQLVGRVQVVLSGGADQFSDVPHAAPSQPPAAYQPSVTSPHDTGLSHQPQTGASPGMLSSNEFWTETLRGRREDNVGSSLTGGTVGTSTAQPAASQEDSVVMKILVEPSLSVVKGLCSVVDIQVIRIELSCCPE